MPRFRNETLKTDMAYELVKKALCEHSSEFPDRNELLPLEIITEKNFSRSIQDAQHKGLNAALEMNSMVKRYRKGEFPKNIEEFFKFKNYLGNLESNAEISKKAREYARDLVFRLQDYANAKLSKKNAYTPYQNPNLDNLIIKVHKASLFYKELIPDEIRNTLVDDFINILKFKNRDISWLNELKDTGFILWLQNIDGEQKGVTVPENGIPTIYLDTRKIPIEQNVYSDKMKAYLFHELRHAWQLWQNDWKEKFGDGSSRLTDLDIEVDAYETQYIMEDLLGIDTNDIYRPYFRRFEQKYPNDPDRVWRYKKRLLYNGNYGKTGKYQDPTKQS